MSDELTSALRDTNEVEITVTGRRSGRESTRPVWFVHEGDNLYLVPLHGTDTNWYRNMLADPAIRVRAGGAEIGAEAVPLDDPGRVEEVVDLFRSRYGADKMETLYSKLDAAVEVPLSSG